MNIKSFSKTMIFSPMLNGECHASTVLQVQKKLFMVAWFAGAKEGNNDVAIWGTYGDGENWATPQRWEKISDIPHWNPVLFRSYENIICLFFKVGSNCSEWVTYVTELKKMGRGEVLWAPAKELIPGSKIPRGPVKNKPIFLYNGILLAPASIEGEKHWDVFVDISFDGGISWTASKTVPIDRKEINGEGVIQPALWESTPGNVHMLARSSCGYLCRSDSNNCGISWSPIYKTDLPNNNSGIDIAKGNDGRLLLALNPVNINWGPRTPLVLMISNDNGLSWQNVIELETENGEFSYPAVININGGFVGTYTWKRKSIIFWKIET